MLRRIVGIMCIKGLPRPDSDVSELGVGAQGDK